MADYIKYPQSIVKIDKDGNEVLSDTLYAGEKVAFTGKTFAQTKKEITDRISEESTGGGFVMWTRDENEPVEGFPTTTLDKSGVSTIPGTYHKEG